jgi:hypothetical protein
MHLARQVGPIFDIKDVHALARELLKALPSIESLPSPVAPVTDKSRPRKHDFFADFATGLAAELGISLSDARLPAAVHKEWLRYVANWQWDVDRRNGGTSAEDERRLCLYRLSSFVERRKDGGQRGDQTGNTGGNAAMYSERQIRTLIAELLLGRVEQRAPRGEKAQKPRDDSSTMHPLDDWMQRRCDGNP